MDAEYRDTLKGLALRVHNAAQNFLVATEGGTPPEWETAADDLLDAADRLDRFLWVLRTHGTES